MQVVWTPTALQTLEKIYHYIYKENPAAAEKLHLRIRTKTLLLGEYPQLGAVCDKLRGVRRLPLGDYPYLIYYQVKPDRIEILRIRHAMRLPPKNLQ